MWEMDDTTQHSCRKYRGHKQDRVSVYVTTRLINFIHDTATKTAVVIYVQNKAKHIKRLKYLIKKLFSRLQINMAIVRQFLVR